MLLRLALALCSAWAVLGSSVEQELAIEGDLSLFCRVTGARFPSMELCLTTQKLRMHPGSVGRRRG